LLTDEIAASSLHLCTYTWNHFSWHAYQVFARLQEVKYLQAANRNATMGRPPGIRTAVTKKLGGSSVGAPWRSWLHPSPHHEYRM